jgi:Pyrimidine reductase, riboflavin biosynthesis
VGELTPETWAELLRLVKAAQAARDGADSEERKRTLTDRLAADDARGLVSVYLRLIQAMARGPLTVAQLGQSLDGRIATTAGHSHYVGGVESLDHLHRLRAMMQAVVVGATTVELDDPQLTTRRVEGGSPVRVVIDPHRRLSPAARVFDGTAPTLILVAGNDATHPAAVSPAVSVAAIARRDGVIDPADILACLRARGLRAVLVEGGARTISLFIHHRRVDRLHLAVAPMLLGSGLSSVSLPPVARMDEAMRLTTHVLVLGSDVLFDCEFA